MAPVGKKALHWGRERLMRSGWRLTHSWEVDDSVRGEKWRYFSIVESGLLEFMVERCVHMSSRFCELADAILNWCLIDIEFETDPWNNRIWKRIYHEGDLEVSKYGLVNYWRTCDLFSGDSGITYSDTARFLCRSQKRSSTVRSDSICLVLNCAYESLLLNCFYWTAKIGSARTSQYKHHSCRTSISTAMSYSPHIYSL